MVFARFLFALLFQGLLAIVFFLRGDPTPIQTAAPWWTVYGSLVDLACLLTIGFFLRPEGLRLSALFDFNRALLWKDLRFAFLLLILFLVLGFGGGMVAGMLIYGAPPPASMGGLPLWGALFSLMVFPTMWGVTEQLTYQGYALPRLQALTGKTWLAVLIVAFGWALQHTALPFLPDWQFILYRFISTLPFAIIIPIYLKTKRLTPFMPAHWGVDMLSVALTSFM
ncbi:type II CAAX prenyl endopeptidase Rce1 family protein [Roseiflexus sp.]|uniref:CPBP family glutamic-type intramembrane protease n=1 Tax=Roseiflexus sp. TaxID=2562120 RepID=UPI0025905C28|nr:CPBP family glutamic-type intramembrane protease [Roseiflexus sp.]